VRLHWERKAFAIGLARPLCLIVRPLHSPAISGEGYDEFR